MWHYGFHYKYAVKFIIINSVRHMTLLSIILGLIWGEINSLYSSGIADYTGDLWNIIDFISNTFYVTWIGLRITSWYVVQVSFLLQTMIFS